MVKSFVLKIGIKEIKSESETHLPETGNRLSAEIPISSLLWIVQIGLQGVPLRWCMIHSDNSKYIRSDNAIDSSVHYCSSRVTILFGRKIPSDKTSRWFIDHRHRVREEVLGVLQQIWRQASWSCSMRTIKANKISYFDIHRVFTMSK